MPEPPTPLDRELRARDVQDLSNSDAIAAFFATLGYRTEARREQTAANLGILAEGLQRPIRRIELLADHEGLFQVYLFELASVTVAHTRALARVFRNRAGNFLLVLTSDFERIDFVGLERYLPEPNGEESRRNITTPQSRIRLRTLTVERRKPTAVHLRVLRRFTWTELDAIAQHRKVLAAFDLAEWSEELFNNRALFSDYYLLTRLRERAEWHEDPKPAFRALREHFRGAGARFSGKALGVIRDELFLSV